MVKDLKRPPVIDLGSTETRFSTTWGAGMNVNCRNLLRGGGICNVRAIHTQRNKEPPGRNNWSWFPTLCRDRSHRPPGLSLEALGHLRFLEPLSERWRPSKVLCGHAAGFDIQGRSCWEADIKDLSFRRHWHCLGPFVLLSLRACKSALSMVHRHSANHNRIAHFEHHLLGPVPSISSKLGEAKLGRFQTGVFPTFFRKGPDCVADPVGTVLRRCF